MVCSALLIYANRNKFLGLHSLIITQPSPHKIMNPLMILISLRKLQRTHNIITENEEFFEGRSILEEAKKYHI